MGDNGCKDAGIGVDGSGAAFDCEEDNRGDPGGEEGGGEEGTEAASVAKAVGELCDVASKDSVSRSDDVTRVIALLMISAISSSVNRSSENTLYFMSGSKVEMGGCYSPTSTE